MSIAEIKSKINFITQKIVSKDTSITKKIEVISSNFKNTPTIIAPDLKINGEISGTGIIEIEGNVVGKIIGNYIILREGCNVNGIIYAESLSIRGKFEGSIKAKTINILGKADVIGEIEYNSLSVEDGASIDGQFKKIN